MSIFVENKGKTPKGGTGLPFFCDPALTTHGQGCCYYNNDIYVSEAGTLPAFQLWYNIPEGSVFSAVVYLINKENGNETLLGNTIGQDNDFLANAVLDKDGNRYGVLSYSPKINTLNVLPRCGTFCIRVDAPNQKSLYSETFMVRPRSGMFLRWKHSKDFLNGVYYGNGFENCIMLQCPEFTRPTVTVNETLNTDGFGCQSISSRANEERTSFVILATEAMLGTLSMIPSHDSVFIDYVFNDINGNERVETIELKDVTITDNGASSNCIHTVSVGFVICKTAFTMCCDSPFQVVPNGG